jgi:hypothetical protein
MRDWLSPSFNQLTYEEKLYGNFMQHNVISHTVNDSMDALD